MPTNQFWKGNRMIHFSILPADSEKDLSIQIHSHKPCWGRYEVSTVEFWDATCLTHHFLSPECIQNNSCLDNMLLFQWTACSYSMEGNMILINVGFNTLRMNSVHQRKMTFSFYKLQVADKGWDIQYELLNTCGIHFSFNLTTALALETSFLFEQIMLHIT